MKNVLVVDDEVGIRELLSEILYDEGYGVLLAENAQQARELCEQKTPDLVLLDIWMPDTDGLTLLKEWVAQDKMRMPVIMMSGHGTIETALEATRIGAADFLEKPVALKKLLATVAKVLQQSQQKLMSPKVEVTQIAEIESAHFGVVLDMPFREARELFDAAYLKYHMHKCANNIPEVAERIGIERTHLYRKLKQLGIKPTKTVDK